MNWVSIKSVMLKNVSASRVNLFFKHLFSGIMTNKLKEFSIVQLLTYFGLYIWTAVSFFKLSDFMQFTRKHGIICLNHTHKTVPFPESWCFVGDTVVTHIWMFEMLVSLVFVCFATVYVYAESACRSKEGKQLKQTQNVF